MQNSTQQFASPQKPINIQPAFHAKPVSTPQATKATDKGNKYFTKSGGIYTPRPQGKPNPRSEADAGSMSRYNPNLK